MLNPSITSYYLSGIWQGLYVKTDTKNDMSDHVLKDFIHLKFNNEHNWQSLCKHLKRKGSFTVASYKFSISTWILQLEVPIFLNCKCQPGNTVHWPELSMVTTLRVYAQFKDCSGIIIKWGVLNYKNVLIIECGRSNSSFPFRLFILIMWLLRSAPHSRVK